MAYCEMCNKPGWAADAMFIRSNPIGGIFVGPCCKGLGDRPVTPAYQTTESFQPPLKVVLPLKDAGDIEYGIKMSNKNGVQAYLNYGGLQISFERSAADIRQWAVAQGLVEDKKAHG